MTRLSNFFFVIFFASFQPIADAKSTELPKISGSQIWVVPEQLNSSSLEEKKEILEIVLTEKNRPPRESTGDIVKALKENSNVSLVCIDKAAADCIEALIRNPKLQEKLKAFVSINGKIYGAEYAEKVPKPFKGISYVEARKLPLLASLQFIYEEVKAWWNASLIPLYAMSPSYRKSYMKENGADIESLANRLPIYWVDESPQKYGTLPFGEPLLNR